MLLWINLACALFLTGLIWFVQIVHYPLFERLGPADFAMYAEAHASLTGRVVGPAMVLELAASLLLAASAPAGLSTRSLWLLAGMTLAIWISTFLVQVPLHERLRHGWDREAWRQLVASNWIRTVLWTGRAGVLLWLAARNR